MKKYILILITINFLSINSQDYYFPPNESEEWERTEFTELGWRQVDIDDIIDFCDTTGTKGLIILKDGKIVLEHYFGDFTAESLWYWASAGKSLTSTMISLAQQYGDLEIEDATSKYLGDGWTKMEQNKEENIRITHQLTMTTGIDYNIIDKNCFEPECLDYLNEPNIHWYYHNAPYRLLLDVLESVYERPINQVTNDLIADKIGMKGFWLNYVRWGRARDLARFGSFICAGGSWKGELELNQDYYNAMKSTSQEMNPAYGYLWWLNGKSKYRLPSLEFDIQGSLVASAPDDMFAALGKNDQKIYIVPSERLVIVRIGESGGESLLAASNYDEKLWLRFSKLLIRSNIETLNNKSTIVYPNPATNFIEISGQYASFELIDVIGKILATENYSNRVDISNLFNGSYYLIFKDKKGEIIQKHILQKIR